uniref:Uncharacterized protein n=1 Tax=Oryza sativa subsp. japonica TaxID=39947 RepID=Q6H4P0_ORYSJ|nr:hypothetical protein [Oryza sativa Japonica Group]BAD26309.1 hypothetical protein [Oryza sativa Japonica Group]
METKTEMMMMERGPHEEIRPAGSLFSTSPLSLPLLLYLSSLSMCRDEGRRGGAGPAGAAAARPPDPAGAGGEARRRPSRQIRQGREGRRVAEPAGAATVARLPDPAGAAAVARPPDPAGARGGVVADDGSGAVARWRPTAGGEAAEARRR